MLWFSFKIALIEIFLMEITLQLVKHILFLVVTHVLFVRHPRFGITRLQRIELKNKSLFA